MRRFILVDKLIKIADHRHFFSVDNNYNNMLFSIRYAFYNNIKVYVLERNRITSGSRKPDNVPRQIIVYIIIIIYCYTSEVQSGFETFTAAFSDLFFLSCLLSIIVKSDLFVVDRDRVYGIQRQCVSLSPRHPTTKRQ